MTTRENVLNAEEKISLTQSELAERLGYTRKPRSAALNAARTISRSTTLRRGKKLCIPPAITFSANPI